MKLFKRIFLAILLIFIVSYAGLSYLLSNRILETNSSFQNTQNGIENYWGTTYEEMISLLPPPEEFSVEGFDQVKLSGVYFNVSDSANCLFIFAHGWARSWENMLKYYPFVEGCGCNIAMYDHRAHGKSEGQYPTGGILEAKDLIMVTEWASEQKGYSWDRIAWVGSSWGAGAVLIAGSEDKDPAFIIADSPYQDWYTAIFERAVDDYGTWINGIAPVVMQWVNMRAGIDYTEASPMEKAKDITEPVLLIHSRADPKTNSQQSVNIAANLNSSSQFHHTEWDNIHVMDVINNREELKEILYEFIAKNDLKAFSP